MLHALLLVAPLGLVFGAAVLTAAALARRFGPPPATDRLVSLDGLRGYLALAVFVHHAMHWRHYARVGVWDYSAGYPAFFRHLGEDSVTLFFMITGFLFAAKLAAGRARPIDWMRLYTGRVLRIYPLYGVALAAALAVTAARTGFELRMPPATLARNVLAWAHFGRPALNGVADAWMATSGVQWSLAYEWLFYAALPLAALLFGVVPPVRWLVASALGVAVWVHWIEYFAPFHLAAFAAGAAASVVTRSARVRAALGGRAGALAAVAAGTAAVTGFGYGYQWPVLLLLSVVFAVVAAGNTLGSVLRWAPSRLLGEVSYGIYLLHGLLLFAAFRGVLGTAAVATLPYAAFWGLVVALTPVLVLVAFAGFRWVERPAIGATPHAQRWLAERLAGGPAPRRREGVVPSPGELRPSRT